MQHKVIWDTSNDGSIEYVQITKELLQECLEAMHRSFYVDENVCVALRFSDQPRCFPEMDKLVSWVAEDRISIAAIEKATGKVVGIAFNKLHGTETSDVYLKHAKLCENSEVRNLLQWMSDVENLFNIYDHCKVKSALEIMFLGILPMFRKRGIAKKLFEVSISVARILREEKAEGGVLHGKPLEIARPPEIVTAICTSFVTHKIAENLKFELAAEMDFDQFVYDGISLGSRMPQHSRNFTYEFLRL